ncbi:MAG TPA: hypothetical protein VFU01_08180 [Gemmatimonadaceae bacterium]|nr:hypothetical protein [Gemmatimonadaceae bacterium]
MRLSVLLVVLLSWGCYSHVPETSVTPAPRTRLRIFLTDAGSTELARYIGPRIVTINGDVIQADSSGDLRIAVSSTVTGEGNETFWKGEAVTVPRGYVAVLQRRQLSKARTVAFVGGLAAAAIGLGQVTGVVGGEGGKGGPPPPPQ